MLQLKLSHGLLPRVPISMRSYPELEGQCSCLDDARREVHELLSNLGFGLDFFRHFSISLDTMDRDVLLATAATS